MAWHDVLKVWNGLKNETPKLQALVYDIHPPTIAITDFTIGLEKPSANGQFFIGAQMTVNLKQTTQIISGISFTTAHVAYASANKSKII